MVNYLGDIKGDTFTIRKTESCPINRSMTGYGGKIPCSYIVEFGKRKYRVYAICWANAASHYIIIGGERYFLHDYDFPTT